MFTIKPEPENRKVFLKFETLDDDIMYEIDKAFDEVGRMLWSDLDKNLKFGKRGGKIFRKGKRNIRHSAAGEYPQRVTGELKKAANYTVRNNQLWFGIEDTAPYAEYLEEGTRNMKPRLLVGHTVKKTDATQKHILETRLDGVIKRG